MGNMLRHRWPQIGLWAPQLVDRMNRQGIEISVLLPCESPEASYGYFLTEQAIEARDMFPERLIAFMSVDPRMGGLAQQIDHFYNHGGCKGFGELIANIPFDDPRNKVIYGKCNDYGLPLVFDMNRNYLTDDARLSRLESCLKEFPNMTLVGHGPCFWAAISADYDAQGGYPKTPVKPGGPAERLLAEYPNMWADVSAGSGYNAMTRDPEFTIGFVQRHWRKLLFGSDIIGHSWPIPQIEWLKNLPVSEEIRTAIASGNARRLLGLDKA
jgi:predicted TIM-barrel fold metal-dependent hydrolase